MRSFKKIVSFLVSVCLVLSLVACGEKTSNTGLTDPNENIISENTETENTITENTITECITSEIYLEEMIVAENKISELLLEEETITEVLECKSIYVPQDNIDEFSNNSQIKQLLGENVNVKEVFEKVALGTGIIVTIAVIKKVGVPDPIVSVVAGAADKSLKFSASGAAIGSLYGGLTGATDELDESGRTSAIIGFATATAGLILSVVLLVGAIPSGGTTTLGLAPSLKLAFAGISVMTASVGTIKSGQNAIQKITSTEGDSIDWDNIDWEKVGVNAAQKSIKNAADGYMWGAFVGTVYGGVEGYEFYHKYNTPYTNYADRLKVLPTSGNGGKWSGKRGESDFILDEPIKLSNGTEITKVTYKNAIPDFSKYAIAEVKIPKMTNQRLGTGGNYEQANTVLAEYWTQIKYQGKSWSARTVEDYRTANNLTWHEMSNMESMQLVPYEVNSTFRHYGGVAEYNAMVGGEGGTDFD